MNTLQFLQHVLPADGLYATIVINDGTPPQQAFFSTVDELATNCLRSDSYGNNTYFAISSFQVKGSRKQENVQQTKVLALDVDCAEDKPYRDQKEGLAALLKFLTDSGLPKPMIVSSGRGLHVYWVMERGIQPEQWKPLAEALKQKVTNLGFLVDNGLTANNALVLRPTDTHNPKNGAVVKVLLPADPTDYTTLQNILGTVQQAPMPDPGTPGPAPLGGMSERARGLLANMGATVDYQPALAEVIQTKCAQIEWAVANAANVPEPLWYNLIGVAAFTTKPEDTAKLWSQGHPSYSEAETLRKLHQWKAGATGPATCTKFETDRPGGCKGCVLKGKIGSPATIGVQRAAVAVSADAPDKIAHETPVPKGFKRVADKTKATVMVQVLDGTDIDVCPFDIYPLGYGRDEALGYETVRFKWFRPHIGWSDLTFRQAYLNDDSREFGTTAADQGIVLLGGKQLKVFQYMLRSYMNELRKTQTMTNIHGSMGWQENFTQFVIGDKIHTRLDDGTVETRDISLSASTNRIGMESYGHKGTVEGWRDGTALFNAVEMPWHIFALGQGFAAPLWVFTGLKGMTVSLLGKSGGGKTIIQMWQQSIWGDPDKLHFAARFTENSMYNRLGIYCNLPMTIDEVSDWKNEEVGTFCYGVTQGQDKTRLNRNSEERATREWATSVTVSTNKSFMGKMAATGLDTDAQMARLLEVTIPKHKLFAKSSEGGRKIWQHITSHYGVVGEVYAKELLRIGEAGLRKRIAEATASFHKMYGFTFTGPERYWETNLVLNHVGMQIAYEAGLHVCDYMSGIKWAGEQLEGMRSSVKDNLTDAFKLVHEYLNEFAGDTLNVMHTLNGPSTMDFNRTPNKDIKARFDVYRKSSLDKYDHGTVMITNKAFKHWIASRGFDYSTVLSEIRAQGIDATPANGRVWMGRNTGLKFGQLGVLGINLNHPEFLGYLADIELAAQEMTKGQFSLV
jgi:hypothetical protein